MSEASSTARVRLHRLRQAGSEGKPCPEGITNEECLAWAEGVWKRQSEAVSRRTVVPFPFNGDGA